MSDYDIHSCSYYCDRHACIERQRNELRDKLFEEISTSERNIQTSDKETSESSQPWVKTYSGGKPNYTQPDGVALTPIEHPRLGKPSEYKLSKEPLETVVLEKEWVGLTDDEIFGIFGTYVGDADYNHKQLLLDARRIEQSLKEKNGG
jgi:hypothetical protein